MPRHGPRGLIVGISMLCGWTILGTAGFTTIEGWPAVDSLYMTISTLSTVGSTGETGCAGERPHQGREIRRDGFARVEDDVL